MIKLWYNSDEVNDFHPIVENAVNAALISCGYDAIAELIQHPIIPNSSTIPDFAIKLKASNRYVFVLEVKKTIRDVNSQRFQNQSRSYVVDFSPYWEPDYPKYFCITNIEMLLLFAERNGPIATCLLKNNPKLHPFIDPITKDATHAVKAFQSTIEQILPLIFNRTPPQWDNNWTPIIDSFIQNFQSISNKLPHTKTIADEVSTYELFRLLAYNYLKDYYNQTNNPNQTYFRNFPLEKDDLTTFLTKLSNNYDRVLQLDFKQVFSNHPNANSRIFPENLTTSIFSYFKNTIKILKKFGSQAVADNPLPEYIFNLLTSKVYDKSTLHKKGKIMSDTELSTLLATVTIDRANAQVLDPCSGDGALLDAAYDYLKQLNLSKGLIKTHNQLLDQVHGKEIDPFLAQLATFRLVAKNLSGINIHTNANIQTGNTFQNPALANFDILLMNPPFLRNDNPDAPITSEDKKLMNTAITNSGQPNFVALASQPNLYFYFVNYVWHYLNDKGRAGLILMAKFLNNEEGKHLKQFLLNKIEAIILYPRNYFTDFKITTLIIVLSKQPPNNIKFLRISNEDLLVHPERIQTILSTNPVTTVTSDYSLKVTNRNLNPSDNWKLFFNDPEDKFQKLDTLSFLQPLNSFFNIKKRGGAENSGGSKIIYPDFSKSPYADLANTHKGYGIKNSRSARNLILNTKDLDIEQAIHFPSKYEDNATYGLATPYQNDLALKTIFETNDKISAAKWKKIVNAAYRSQVPFDLLIPRAERKKHSCFYNPHSDKVVISTNFFLMSDFQNGNEDTSISKESQIKYIAAFLNSCFGQIQFEIHSNNQEGLRKLEGFHIDQFKIPDLKQLTKAEIEEVVTAFERLSTQNQLVSGGEGLNTPRRQLDETIAEIIYRNDNLGFQSIIQLTDFFELFLADLVEDRSL